MDQKDTRIEELRSRITESRKELKEIFIEAAERIVSDKLYSGDDDNISKLLASISERESNLENIDSQMNDIRTSYNRISEIAEREKEIGEEYAQLEKENKKLLAPLGRSAYALLKGGDGSRFGKIYETLVRVSDEIEEQDSVIFRLESSGAKKGFFKGIKDKSHIAVLKSKKKRLESSLDSNFLKFGEKIYKKEPDLLASLKDQSVQVFRSNRQGMTTLDEEIGQLKEENKQLEAYLKSKYNSNRQKKTEEKMQSIRDLALSEKMAGIYELGAKFHREKIKVENKAVSELFENADSIIQSIEEKEKEIEKLNAELEITRLEDEVSEMKNNIKDLESTIEKCNNDISEFNSEIKRTRAEIRKLKKITEENVVGS